MSKHDLNKVRNKLKEKQGGKYKDPAEFRPPQVKDGETARYRFFILPPLEEGDTCVDGKASRSMELFFVQNGSHFLNNRMYQCPRVHDEEECPVCQLGFDLIGETQDKKRRSEIARQFLPRTQYAVNIYFPKDDVNPSDVAGKVLWLNASKQIYDKLEECIMREDAGDPADPQPYGIFYDEEAAYLFQLEVNKKGEWNNYSNSKFLTSVGKRPIAGKSDNPNKERIQQILDARHDLFTKFAPRDRDKLEELANDLRSHDPHDDEDDAGFDEDEDDFAPEPAKPKAQSEAKSKSKPKPKPKAEPEPEPKSAETEEVLFEDDEGPEGPAKPESEESNYKGKGKDKKQFTASKDDKGGGSDIEDDELQGLLDEIESD